MELQAPVRGAAGLQLRVPRLQGVVAEQVSALSLPRGVPALVLLRLEGQRVKNDPTKVVGSNVGRLVGVNHCIAGER